MRVFTAVIERCPDTGLFVGYIPGFPGAHSQGESIDDLQDNLSEVIGMLLEDGEPKLESEFVGTHTVQVACEQEERELTEAKKNDAISIV